MMCVVGFFLSFGFVPFARNCFRFISTLFTQFVIVFKLLPFRRSERLRARVFVLMLCKLNGFHEKKHAMNINERNRYKVHNNLSEFVANGLLVESFFPNSAIVADEIKLGEDGGTKLEKPCGNESWWWWLSPVVLIWKKPNDYGPFMKEHCQ